MSFPDSCYALCTDLRARFHVVGDNFHKRDGSRIVRAIWHPLGVEGASLVVLTNDGMIRSVPFCSLLMLHPTHTAIIQDIRLHNWPGSLI